MKFNQLSTRLTDFSFDVPFALQSPDLEEYYAPLVEGLRASGAENWEGFFWLSANHLIKSSMPDDRILIHSASSDRLRLGINHGHTLLEETGAGPLADIRRKPISAGTVDITVTHIETNTPIDDGRRRLAIVLSDSLNVALSLSLKALEARIPLFLLTRIEGDETGTFVEFHKSLGDQARMAAWQGINESARQVVIAALTFGGQAYEI